MIVSTLFLLAALVSAPADSGQPKFYGDDPIWADDDTIDTPIKPGEIELSDLYDRFGHIAHDFGSGVWGEAENVNTLDEVPDSSWFTNRHGRKRMSIDDLVKGPYTTPPPHPERGWTIFRGKTQGITPGFHIMDDQGDRYVIKAGAPGYPELNSSSEMIATRIFYALGYNTPENFIVYIRPEHLTVKEGTMVEDRFGDKVHYTKKMVVDGLKIMTPEADGSYRMVASKYIDGQPLGPFRYYGKRSDDPNDIYDHEQRRELRGLRLIAAWVNHDDTRAHNTQDSWVEEGGRRYIRHYLIDFGSCFGSGSSFRQLPNLAYHYWLEPEEVKRNALGFGFHVPTYRKVEFTDDKEFPGIGRFESKWFVPEEWKNDYPNPAFVRMTERDAFWAAKLIMSFTEEELRAITKTGKFKTEKEEDYFVNTLVIRQRKSGGFGLNRVNPLDEFRLENGVLSFTNLSQKYGLGASGSTYRAQWGVLDNATGNHRDVGQPVSATNSRFQLPRMDLSGAGDPYMTVAIRTDHADHPNWKKMVRVYLRPQSGNFEIVGIDRESTPSLPPVKK